MNLKLSGIVIASIIGAGLGGFAKAQSPVQTPAPPCIWSATYQYKTELVPPKNPKDPREIRAFERMRLIMPRPKLKTVYVTADATRIVVQWVMGRTTESWNVGKLVLYSMPSLPEGEVTYQQIYDEEKADNGEILHKHPGSVEQSFPELSWINPNYFAGKVSIQGVVANYFVNPPPAKAAAGAAKEGDIQSPAPVSPVAKSGGHVAKQEAWLDAKTGFPIAMEDDNVRVAYKLFKETPSAADMKMPPAYQQLWDRLKQNP